MNSRLVNLSSLAGSGGSSGSGRQMAWNELSGEKNRTVGFLSLSLRGGGEAGGQRASLKRR